MNENRNTAVVHKGTIPGIRKLRGEAPYTGGEWSKPASRATKRQLGGAALLGKRGGSALLGEKGGVYTPGDNDYPDDQRVSGVEVLNTPDNQQDEEIQ